MLVPKTQELNDLSIIGSSELGGLALGFKDDILYNQFKRLVKLSKRPEKNEPFDYLDFHCTISALRALKVDMPASKGFARYVRGYNQSLEGATSDARSDIVTQLDTLVFVQGQSEKTVDESLELGVDVSSIYGRQAVVQKVHALTARNDNLQKMKLLQSLFEESSTGIDELCTLLAVREIVTTCESKLTLQVHCPLQC